MPPNPQGNSVVATEVPQNPIDSAMEAAAQAAGFVTPVISRNAPGATINTSRADEERKRQQALLMQLLAQARNGNPAALAQLRQGTQAAQSGAMALGQNEAQQHGISNLAAMQGIAGQQARAGQVGANQENVLKAQSQVDAQNQMAQLLGGQGSLDLQQSQAAQQAAQGVTAMNRQMNQNSTQQVGNTLQAGGSAIESAMSFGGKVPGKAKVFGDDERNDLVPAKLSAGEIVIPRSIALGPDPVGEGAKFIATIKKKHMAGGEQGFDDGGQVWNANTGWSGNDVGVSTTGTNIMPSMQAPSIQNGGLLDTTQLNQNRDSQLQLSDLLANSTAGTGPSPVATQAGMAEDSAVANALSGGSAMAGGHASQLGNILGAQTGQLGSIGEAAGAARAMEMSKAQSADAAQLQALRGLDINRAKAQQAAGWQNTLSNAGVSLQNASTLRNILSAGGQGMTKAATFANKPEFGEPGQAADAAFDAPSEAMGGEIPDWSTFAKAVRKKGAQQKLGDGGDVMLPVDGVGQEDFATQSPVPSQTPVEKLIQAQYARRPPPAPREILGAYLNHHVAPTASTMAGDIFTQPPPAPPVALMPRSPTAPPRAPSTVPTIAETDKHLLLTQPNGAIVKIAKAGMSDQALSKLRVALRPGFSGESGDPAKQEVPAASADPIQARDPAADLTATAPANYVDPNAAPVTDVVASPISADAAIGTREAEKAAGLRKGRLVDPSDSTVTNIGGLLSAPALINEAAKGMKYMKSPAGEGAKAALADSIGNTLHEAMPDVVDAPSSRNNTAVPDDFKAKDAPPDTRTKSGDKGKSSPGGGTGTGSTTPMAGSEEMEKAHTALGDETAAVQDQAAIAARQQQNEFNLRQQGLVNDAKLAAQQTKLQTDYHAELQRRTQQAQAAIDKWSSASIDPDHFWANRTTADKIFAVIGVALGGIGGGTNQASQILDKAIDRDFEAQKANLEKMGKVAEGRGKILGIMRENFDSENGAMNAARQAAYTRVENQIKANGALYGQLMANPQGQQLMAQIQQKGLTAEGNWKLEAQSKSQMRAIELQKLGIEYERLGIAKAGMGMKANEEVWNDQAADKNITSGMKALGMLPGPERDLALDAMAATVLGGSQGARVRQEEKEAWLTHNLGGAWRTARLFTSEDLRNRLSTQVKAQYRQNKATSAKTKLVTNDVQEGQ